MYCNDSYKHYYIALYMVKRWEDAKVQRLITCHLDMLTWCHVTFVHHKGGSLEA